MFIAVLASLMLSYTYFISMSALKDELTQVTASCKSHETGSPHRRSCPTKQSLHTDPAPCTLRSRHARPTCS